MSNRQRPRPQKAFLSRILFFIVTRTLNCSSPWLWPDSKTILFSFQAKTKISFMCKVHRKTGSRFSVTSKTLPNVYKKWPKTDFTRKRKDFDSFNKLPKMWPFWQNSCGHRLRIIAFNAINRPIWSHWANWSWKQVCLPTPTTHARSRITKRLVSEIGKCLRVRFFLFSVRNRNLKENYSENFDAFIDFFVERQNYCQQISSSWSFYRLMSTFCPRLKYALFEILTNVQRNKN